MAIIMLQDLTSPWLIYAKGCLFVLLGILAGGMVLTALPSWREGLVLAICIWSFCRAYYFVFYVIEHYVDPSFKFTGLIDFFKYLTFKTSQSKSISLDHRSSNPRVRLNTPIQHDKLKGANISPRELT